MWLKLNNSVFNIAVCNSDCIVLSDWMIVNDDLGNMWKELVVAKMLHLHGGTEVKPWKVSLAGVSIKIQSRHFVHASLKYYFINELA
jgi:hypothetical protein